MSSSSQENLLTSLKQAYTLIQELEAQVATYQEPIAIIGMSCRFPGGANDPTAYWQLLQRGGDAIRQVPDDRWDIERYYDPNPDAPGKMYTRQMGFLDTVSQFDPLFFGISPREAHSLDPQQRLLLEVSWEALENAGQTPSQAAAQTGVFVGIGQNDYAHLEQTTSSLEQLDSYTATGNSFCFASGRLSYTLGLQGPNMALDTACSSSLVAVHLACQSLRMAECDIAIAGGVQLILAPEVTVALSRMRALSPDGRCKTFDAAADGYGRGEGCGMIVLKRLSTAQRAGDRILALIRGSAVNHDGPSSGLTVPNKVAQVALIQQALKTARVKPEEVDYIEAHGTGTALGDPIEVRALSTVMKERTTPLLIGSVKTNIGHLEAAAGIAGLIKVVLSFQHDTIPPHLHFNAPNPHLNWDDLAMQVPTVKTAWPTGKSHIAGVSSFGLSGTNAHIVLEEAPKPKQTKAQRRKSSLTVERPLHLLTLSAKSEPALAALLGRYQHYLATGPNAETAALPELADICFTANTGRVHHNYRLSAVAASHAQLQEKLAALSVAGVKTNWVGSAPPIAFLFTGQGAQYVQMGRALYESQPLFRQAIDRCAEILRPYLAHSLLDILDYQDKPLPPRDDQSKIQNPKSKIDATAYTQPALFAVEYALAEVWRSWGIQPSYVCGHSVGEYVAACVAGVFTLEEGLRLIAERGRLMQALPPDGAMVAVAADEAFCRQAIAPYGDALSLAAINGPENVVISGQRQAIGDLSAKLNQQGIKTTPLTVSHAFHSALMEPMLADFRAVAQGIHFQTPQIPLVSNVSGQVVGEEITTADYWVRHVRQPVRFAEGIETLRAKGVAVFVELGPKPVLLGMGRRVLPADYGRWLPSLRPAAEWEQMLGTLGALYELGVAVDWRGMERDYARRHVALPTYPFQRQRYWLEQTNGSQPAPLHRHPQTPSVHPLLGQRLESAAFRHQESLFEVYLQANQPAYLADHRVFSQVIVPATAYLEMGLAAGRQLFPGQALALTNVRFQQALVLPEHDPEEAGGTRLQVLCTPDGAQKYAFEIFTHNAAQTEPASPWLRHAQGALETSDSQTPSSSLSLLQSLFSDERSVPEFYQQFRTGGLAYGTNFQAIERLWARSGEAFAHLRLPEALRQQASDYQLHPSLLDGCFQTLAAAFDRATSPDSEPKSYLPVGCQRLTLFAPPTSAGWQSLWCHAQLHAPTEHGTPNRLSATLQLFAEDGTPLAQVEELILQAVTADVLQRQPAQDERQWLYAVDWQNQEPSQTEISNQMQVGDWLILTAATPTSSGTGDALAAGIAARLRAHGAACQVHDLPTGAESQALLNKILADSVRPLQGILYLVGQERPPAGDELPNAPLLGTDHLLSLVQTLTRRALTPRLWLVTCAAQSVQGSRLTNVAGAALWGLGQTIAVEHPEWQLVRLDVDSDGALETQVEAIWQELQQPGQENQVAYRNGSRYVARLVSLDQQALPTDFTVRLTEYGLTNFHFVPITPEAVVLPAPMLEIDVQATGLNFRDVLNGLGMLQEYYAQQMGIHAAAQMTFGFECAGIVRRVGAGVADFKVGDEVVCAIANDCLGSRAIVDARFVAHKPTRLSFAEAATIPLVFATAVYGLEHLARLQPGERVLIHAAAGGVGQAAVQLALAAGAEIFATASPSKWDFLKSLGIQHLYNSRTLSFGEEILADTQGEGVAVVLNSLNGDFIAQSFACLAQHGRFIELGKLGIWQPQQVAALRPDVAYYPFDLGEVALANPDFMGGLLKQLITRFEQGCLQPLPMTVFPAQEVSNAFRYIAQARQIGKVVITLPPSSQRQLIRADASYLITGGLGGLGLKVAHWLAQTGAGEIILSGRQGADGKEELVSALAETGVTIRVVKGDVANEADVARMIAAATLPLRGVIHAAGLLDDGLLRRQTAARLAAVMAPKVQGAWHLHRQSIALPLDFFVCFSSTASLLGAPGQGNYAAANAFLDGLAHYRRRHGLPALSINWGPWAEVGMAAQLGFGGMEMIPPAGGIRVLAGLLGTNGQVGVLRADWAQLLAAFPSGQTPPFLAKLNRQVDGAQASAPRLRETLATLPPEERLRFLIGEIQQQSARVLGLKATQLDAHYALTQVGLDSLMAIELRNQLKKDFGVDVPIEKFIEGRTIAQLAELVLEQIIWSAVIENQPLAVALEEEMEEFTL